MTGPELDALVKRAKASIIHREQYSTMEIYPSFLLEMIAAITTLRAQLAEAQSCLDREKADHRAYIAKSGGKIRGANARADRAEAERDAAKSAISEMHDLASSHAARAERAESDLTAIKTMIGTPWNPVDAVRVLKKARDQAEADLQAIAELNRNYAVMKDRAEAERDKMGRALNVAKYGQPDFSWELHKMAMREAVDQRDRAEAALAAQPSPDVEALVDLLEGWLAISENCEITSGVCCCGDDMDNHAEPMSCGHVATDHGAYISRDHALATSAALARVKGCE